jgi:hypothetical protein
MNTVKFRTTEMFALLCGFCLAKNWNTEIHGEMEIHGDVGISSVNL